MAGLGSTTAITHHHLAFLDRHYPLSRLLPLVRCRSDRCALERVMACLLQSRVSAHSLFGDTFEYCSKRGDVKFAHLERLGHLPVGKVWMGR